MQNSITQFEILLFIVSLTGMANILKVYMIYNSGYILVLVEPHRFMGKRTSKADCIFKWTLSDYMVGK